MKLETRKSQDCAESSAQTSVQDIVTPRLELISITPEMLRADATKSAAFSQLINAEVPADWPPDGWDEDAYHYLLTRMDKYPQYPGWSRYIAVKHGEGGRRILAGGCGLLDPVELNDDPEIGYGLLPAYQRRGLATEAVDALVNWIFEHPHVKSIHAQTLPHLQGSIRVLVKNGFAPAGEGREEGAILFRKFRE